MDDKIVQTQLSQDIDFLEVLSLKLRMKDSYRLHSSSYGIVMGRVLANDAFGVPNAKVSIFIERDGNEPIDIRNLYPYESVMSRGKNGVKYNLLHDVCDDVCHADVGTFPNKRRVLDNDTVLYVYDKYYKYTTSTNSAGDYMIYGVPVGSQQVHVDIDLSDIGVLSQRPRDMVYKGYDINEFENACQFKTSTNLYNLPQIITQEQNVDVYPFFGDSKQNDIAISRCDIHINYKFEPTCVFMGSVVTDNGKNAISNRCRPSRKAGYNRNLVVANGTIEMIRKTPGGYVEEYNVNGAQLIDGDGVWCYQIPMNLDYIGTDEYGNMVPTDDPKKGIPTRSRVRFRISINETGEEAASRHRAKMLVPSISSDGKYSDEMYEFGSDTPEEYYRDIYWNKVYSIKSYIPRLQKYGNPKFDRFSGLKKLNDDGNFNPIPFNTVRVRTPFAYSLLCALSTILVGFIAFFNNAFVLATNIALGIVSLGITKIKESGVPCIPIASITNSNDDGNVYAPGCKSGTIGAAQLAKKKGVSKSKVKGSGTEVMDKIQESLAEEFDVVNMDFSNDWLNGCVYMPMFHYKGRMKWTIFGIPFTHTSRKRFCSCDIENRRLKLYESCALIENPSKDGISIVTNGSSSKKEKDGRSGYADDEFELKLKHGIIKEYLNRDGLPIYYYEPGEKIGNTYFHLYSNDLILLGSVNECDTDGIPQLIKYIPSTTSNIPDFYAEYEGDEDTGDYEVTGVDWGSDGDTKVKKFRGGYFTNIKCSKVHTNMKTCVNAERLCELGVGLETKGEESVSVDGGKIKDITISTLGAVTHKDVFGDDSRSVFATLNSNPLVAEKIDKSTGYRKYDFDYVYTMGFDGKMNSAFKEMDLRDKSELSDSAYIKYRFGGPAKYGGSKRGGKLFPIYNNSFYFYFGLINGKTAMDKLNRLYYSECKEPDVEGFSYTVESQTNKECSEDKAFIKLNLRNVARPCNITVERNDAVVEELCRNNYNNTEYEMTDGVKNGKYRITIEDVNGIIKSEDVSLVNDKMGLLYDKDNLGFDYDAHADEPNYGQENGRNGKFIISGATIYGESVRFKEINIKSNTNPYELICKTEDGKEVSVLIEHNDSTPYEYKVDETTEDKNTYQYYVMKYDNVSKGNSVSFVLICDGEDTEYFNNFEYGILNGEDFRAYVNDMPAENILAMNDGWGYDADDPSKWGGEYTDEVEKFNAVMSVCSGIYCTETDENLVLTAVGGNDLKYMYTAPNVDAPDEDGNVTKFVETNQQDAYINPDIPFEKGKEKTDKISGDDSNKYYYFAVATNNGEGEFQTLPPKASEYLITEKNENRTSIDKDKADNYIKIPYIDRRLYVYGEISSKYVFDGESERDLSLYGGVEMKYDSEGKCIGDGLEWIVGEDGKIKKNTDGEGFLYNLTIDGEDVTDKYKFDGFDKGDKEKEYFIKINDGIKDGEYVTIDATSCSYNIQAVENEIDETTKEITGYVSEGENKLFKYPLNVSTIKFVGNRLVIGKEEMTPNYVSYNTGYESHDITISVTNDAETIANVVHEPYMQDIQDIEKPFVLNFIDERDKDERMSYFNTIGGDSIAYMREYNDEGEEVGENVASEDDCEDIKLRFKDKSYNGYGYIACLKEYKDGDNYVMYYDRTLGYDFRLLDVKVNNSGEIIFTETNKNEIFIKDGIAIAATMNDNYYTFETVKYADGERFTKTDGATLIYLESKCGFTAVIDFVKG